MLRSTIAAVIALVALSTVASEAKTKRATGFHPECNVTMPCEGAPPAVRSNDFLQGVRSIRVTMKRVQASRSPAGLVAPLAAKAAEISQACGATIISAVRHTYVRGTRRISLHAAGKAVDMAGNPSCIYQQLAGWPGGYSTDYARVRHVHISYDREGGREWGLRFAHRGHKRHARRYAAR